MKDAEGMAKLLAQQIFETNGKKANEKAVLDVIATIPAGSPQLVEKYLKNNINLAPLVWAIFYSFNGIVVYLIKNKLTIQQFQESFICDTSEAQAAASSLFIKLFEFDLNSFPENIKQIIENLKNRKMLALIAGVVGRSTISGIPWEHGGHHNYSFVSKLLFQMLASNNKQIMEAIDKTFNSNQQKELTKKAIEETFRLMQALPNSNFQGKILPFLVGTSNGESALHAEGCVWYPPKKYLMVDRSKYIKPGIEIYEATDKFNAVEFHTFLKTLPASTEGAAYALDYEDGYLKFNIKGWFKSVDHIPMIRQNEENCTTASAEGLFLATLYCQLLELGLDSKSSIHRAKAITIQIFDTNRKLELEKMQKHASDKHDAELDNFLAEIHKKEQFNAKQQTEQQANVKRDISLTAAAHQTMSASTMTAAGAIAASTITPSATALNRIPSREILNWGNLGKVDQEEDENVQNWRKEKSRPKLEGDLNGDFSAAAAANQTRTTGTIVSVAVTTVTSTTPPLASTTATSVMIGGPQLKITTPLLKASRKEILVLPEQEKHTSDEEEDNCFLVFCRSYCSCCHKIEKEDISKTGNPALK